MGKTMLGVFFGLVMVIAGASAALAHQAGGVEVGDLETGSVVGQPFKELDVDAELFAIEIGNLKSMVSAHYRHRLQSARRPSRRHQGDKHVSGRTWLYIDVQRNRNRLRPC